MTWKKLWNFAGTSRRKFTIRPIVEICAGGASVIEFYDRDYYERGLASGKSNYDNYRWIPELTFPMAMTIIDVLGIRRGDRVLRPLG